ncbi:MAG: hypothetical protein ACT4PT_00005, partial [Methanobacteriota archaeon]
MGTKGCTFLAFALLLVPGLAAPGAAQTGTPSGEWAEQQVAIEFEDLSTLNITGVLLIHRFDFGNGSVKSADKIREDYQTIRNIDRDAAELHVNKTEQVLTLQFEVLLRQTLGRAAAYLPRSEEHKSLDQTPNGSAGEP